MAEQQADWSSGLTEGASQSFQSMPQHAQQPQQLNEQQPQQPSGQSSAPSRLNKPFSARFLGIAGIIVGIFGLSVSWFFPLNVFAFPLYIVGIFLGKDSLAIARGGQGSKAFGVAGLAVSITALVIAIAATGIILAIAS
jgi:hypothetical protein